MPCILDFVTLCLRTYKWIRTPLEGCRPEGALAGAFGPNFQCRMETGSLWLALPEPIPPWSVDPTDCPRLLDSAGQRSGQWAGLGGLRGLLLTSLPYVTPGSSNSLRGVVRKPPFQVCPRAWQSAGPTRGGGRAHWASRRSGVPATRCHRRRLLLVRARGSPARIHGVGSGAQLRAESSREFVPVFSLWSCGLAAVTPAVSFRCLPAVPWCLFLKFSFQPGRDTRWPLSVHSSAAFSMSPRCSTVPPTQPENSLHLPKRKLCPIHPDPPSPPPAPGSLPSYCLSPRHRPLV